MFECRIKLSNSEKSFVLKSIEYDEGVVVSEEDPLLRRLIDVARSEFKGEVEDVTVTLILRL